MRDSTIFTAFLPVEELAEALHADNRRELVIAGIVDNNTQTLLLFMGDLSSVIAPLHCFEASPTGERPEFENFEIIDYGNTLKFGDYEASTGAVLYEFKGIK